jgi:DNA-directed RNA polymerase subunit K/omega
LAGRQWHHPDAAASLAAEGSVIVRPVSTNAFEFVIVSALRAAQLMRGCTPRVVASHKAVITAQREVAEGKISHTSKAPEA